jgi:hypothetical protein
LPLRFDGHGKFADALAKRRILADEVFRNDTGCSTIGGVVRDQTEKIEQSLVIPPRRLEVGEEVNDVRFVCHQTSADPGKAIVPSPYRILACLKEDMPLDRPTNIVQRPEPFRELHSVALVVMVPVLQGAYLLISAEN